MVASLRAAADGPVQTLIDGRSYQMALHKGALGRPAHKGRRLNGLLAMVEEVLGEPPRVSELPLTAKGLEDVGLLIILTRRRDEPDFRFCRDEFQGIEGHLRTGGALLVMTNHAPYAENDRVLINQVAGRYGVSVGGLEGIRGQGETHIEGDDIKSHPITKGVQALHFRSSHILSCSPRERVSILATIPGLSAPHNVFAVAIDGPGRMVIGADSGFICDESDAPDTGYLDHEDNRRFTCQLLEWLCWKR